MQHWWCVLQSLILTPDQRVRVFVSSTLEELADERAVVRRSIEALQLAPVMFELGARPHPPRSLYRAYLDQSHIFVALYWQRYGWVAPGMSVSGLEDEYLLSDGKPRLVYVKRPSASREQRLDELLDRVRAAGDVSYRAFDTADELERLVLDDLAALLSETFQSQWDSPSLEPRFTLPTPPTRFVGRQAEVAHVGELVRHERLVTLTGPGGIGKTRLAVQVASDVAAHFADGAVFIGLAALDDDRLVATTIAGALGVRDERPERLLETLKDHLSQRQMLLVLDNFEHVLAASDVVSALIEAAPGSTLLITSREALACEPNENSRCRRCRQSRRSNSSPSALPRCTTGSPWTTTTPTRSIASSPHWRVCRSRSNSPQPGFGCSRRTTSSNASTAAWTSSPAEPETFQSVSVHFARR